MRIWARASRSAQGAVPDDFGGYTLGGEVGGRAEGAAVNGLPVLVCQALGDDDDAIGGGRSAQPESSGQRREINARDIANPRLAFGLVITGVP